MNLQAEDAARRPGRFAVFSDLPLTHAGELTSHQLPDGCGCPHTRSNRMQTLRPNAPPCHLFSDLGMEIDLTIFPDNRFACNLIRAVCNPGPPGTGTPRGFRSQPLPFSEAPIVAKPCLPPSPSVVSSRWKLYSVLR